MKCHEYWKLWKFYISVPHLVSLCLYNVKIIGDANAFLANLVRLKELRHLDISHANHKHGCYKNAHQILAKLVSGLPNLVSLDVRRTNLAGRGVAERPVDDTTVDYGLCDIQELAFRVNNPLQFLGLYGTRDGVHTGDMIFQLKSLAGDANDEQIFIAARVSMDNNLELLQRFLNNVYRVFINN